MQSTKLNWKASKFNIKISDIVDSTTYSIFEDVTSTAAAVTLALFDKIEVLGFHALQLTKSRSISPWFIR